MAKYISKCGYLYRNNKESSSYNQKDNVINLIYRIYIYDAMIDFSLNLTSNKKVLVNYVFYILKNKYLKDALYSNDYNYNLFISCLDRFFKCNLISDEFKTDVRQRVKTLNFIRYNITN